MVKFDLIRFEVKVQLSWDLRTNQTDKKINMWQNRVSAASAESPVTSSLLCIAQHGAVSPGQPTAMQPCVWILGKRKQPYIDFNNHLINVGRFERQCICWIIIINIDFWYQHLCRLSYHWHYNDTNDTDRDSLADVCLQVGPGRARAPSAGCWPPSTGTPTSPPGTCSGRRWAGRSGDTSYFV